MYAITGITGQVGGALASNLLAAGQRVRAVVRDPAKAAVWAEKCCEIAVAEMDDAAALTRAFEGATGVFVLLPPVFDPTPGFAEARAVITSLRQALDASRPPRVVVLSTVGVQAVQTNLLSQLTLMEEALAPVQSTLTFLRSAWFMENARWDVASARERGVIDSFLQPLDRAIPMVATEDVGRVAAELLMQSDGPRIVELEGPALVSPLAIAEAFATALGRPVRTEVVPRERWESLFRAQGMRNPAPRMQMLDGFNAGWIAFEGGAAQSRKGTVTLADVVRGLLA